MSHMPASPHDHSPIKLALQLLIAGLCALVLAACGGGGDGSGGGQLDAGATLQSITVTAASPNVAKGLYMEFRAVGTWSDGTSRDISSEVNWASSTPSIVQITNDGRALGLETGNSVITANMGGVSGSLSLDVTAATLQSISLNSPDCTLSHLPKGLTCQFVATGTFSDGTSRDITNDVTWASAEQSVATINATGLAIGVAPGTSGISATRDGVTASNTLTVTSAVPVSLAVTPANVSLPKGLTTSLFATATYSDGISQDVTGIVEWSVSLADASKASVSSAGVVIAKNTGTAIVTAGLVSTTVQGQATITVTSAELQSIAVTPADRSIAKGLNQQFSASGTYSDGSTTNISGSVIWSSENTTVATVVAGMATGVGVGSTGIRATLGSISGSATLTVTPATLQSITVTPASASIAKGLTQQLVATGHYSDGTSQSVADLVWSSNATAVATVNSSGLATGVALGRAQITAASGSISGGMTLMVTLKESILHSFTGGTTDGERPQEGLVMDSAGNLYGATSLGGAYDYGTVFKINAVGTKSILHSFAGGTADGRYPSGGLIMDGASNLYGTTSNGGVYGSGTVFKIDTAGGKSILHSLGGAPTAGKAPYGKLVMDSTGNFYGMTAGGGANGIGTVFKVDATRPEDINILYSVRVNEGSGQRMGLVMDGAGNLYSTFSHGGPNGYGTVIKIYASGAAEAIYIFRGGATHGQYPYGGVIIDSAGNLYGTTMGGGAYGSGTVFKIDTAGTEHILYSFMSGTIDGGDARGDLIMDSARNLYGTTNSGGAYGYGTVFKIDTVGGESILHSFAGGTTDGQYPNGGLIMDSAGNLYGSTQEGGANGKGTVFKISNY